MPTIRTPVPPLPAFVDGEFVTQRRLNALPEHLRQLYDYRMGGFRTEKPMAIVTQSTSTIDHNIYSVRSFSSEVLDTDGMWSASSPSIIRINTAGIYLIEWQVAIAAPSTVTADPPYVAALIYSNGLVAETDALALVRTRVQLGQPSQLTIAVPAPLDVGATLRFVVVQFTGVTQSVDATHGGCKATVEWLAPLDTKRGAVAL